MKPKNVPTSQPQLSEQPSVAKPHIFPTRGRRDKHSRLLSYPIGAEILSRSLDGVPQHAMIDCVFRAGNPHLQRRVPHLTVLTLTYNGQPLSRTVPMWWIKRGWLEPGWTIRVNAIPRKFSNDVRLKLVEDVLPGRIRDWLIHKAPLDGQVTLYGITISLEVASGQLVERRGW
jgi:hypothetical protein